MVRRSLPPLSFPPDANKWAEFLIRKLPKGRGYYKDRSRVALAAEMFTAFGAETHSYLESLSRTLIAYSIRCQQLEEMLKASAEFPKEQSTDTAPSGVNESASATETV